jgi:carboxymethylenebutenolidase
LRTTAQTVSIPAHSTRFISGYLVRPTTDRPFPGVVVIHEAFGLNDDIWQITERFAAEGYVALGVDLFAGRNRVICMARLIGGMILNPLNHAGIHDLQAALTFLSDDPNVDSNRLGAIGFCMGGNYAICLACTDERVRVVAPYYALNPRPLEAIARSCPVVGSYPQNDFTAAQARKLDAALTEHRIPHDIKIYPDTGHSFANRRRTYNEPAAEDAWQRTLFFFKEHIGS